MLFHSFFSFDNDVLSGSGYHGPGLINSSVVVVFFSFRPPVLRKQRPISFHSMGGVLKTYGFH